MNLCMDNYEGVARLSRRNMPYLNPCTGRYNKDMNHRVKSNVNK